MRVVIAEDSVLLRDGIVRMLEAHQLDVAGTAGDAEELLALVEAQVPDLVITDVRMPPGFAAEGLQAALTLRERHPDLPVVVLSQYVEERYASRLLEQCPTHVGYLLKDRVADVADFVDALRRVHAGACVLDPEVVSQLLVRHRDRPLDRLTPRESEVRREMARGRSNTGIAEALTISVSAVAKHVNAIFTKLDLHESESDHRRVLAVQHYLGRDPGGVR